MTQGVFVMLLLTVMLYVSFFDFRRLLPERATPSPAAAPAKPQPAPAQP